MLNGNWASKKQQTNKQTKSRDAKKFVQKFFAADTS